LESISRIETKHYFLRGVNLEDAEALFTFMGDAGTMTYITPHPATSIDEVKNKIMRHLENFKVMKEIPWVIVSKDLGEIIGFFRFHKLNLWHKKAEMGAVIRKDYQQKGVMTEVLKAVLDFGFDRLGLNRIVGDVFADNKGSEKLLQKYGFFKEGQLRQTDFDGVRYHDTVVYSLLKSEYGRKHD
jgi:[ribosomal protein S5]-alanine N-acetyltransferase